MISRRVLLPLLLPRLDLCLPTGLNLEGNRVVVVKDSGKSSASLVKELDSQNATVLVSNLLSVKEDMETWVKEGPILGVYFLAGLDVNPDWGKDQAKGWSSFLEERLTALYHIAHNLPEPAFLIGATRMGGLQGISHAANPLGGGISGFLKALRRERPGSLVKTIDFGGKSTAAGIARVMVAETLLDGENGEIGYEGDLRFGITLQPGNERAVQSPDTMEGNVFIVSGGSGGITASVVLDLAGKTRGKFYLLGRTALLPKENKDLVSLKNDRAAFKPAFRLRWHWKGGR